MSKPNFNCNFAVIIGINKYQNSIRELKTAVPDALKLAQIIQKQHENLKPQYQAQSRYEVQLFLNQRASFTQLNQLFADFKQEQIPVDKEKVTVTKDDRLLFYFAGHGIALDALENQEGPVGYLIPQDAKSGDSSTYLPMQELHDALNALPCRHMLAILDCCFAGAFRWASLKREIVPKVKVYKERYDRFISDRAWQVITSAADDQKALDSLGSRGIITERNEVHSPFAKALFDALRGEGADLNKDGIITATELYLYLRDKVEVLTENHYKRQTPGLCPLRKHDKGEFIFLSPEFDRDNLEDAPPLNPANNPYKGLQSYDETDSKLFFGRDKNIKELYQQVVDDEQVFTVVLGASGTGKSSLMKAGLLPRLRHSQEHHYQILDPMRPGESPLKSLAQVCLPITDEDAAQTMSDIKQLSEDLKKKKQDLENLIIKYNNPNPELLQVVEQLTLREDLLDIEHLKFTDEIQQSLSGIFSRINDTEKQLVSQWIKNFRKRKQLHEELTKPIENLSKALKQETQDLTTIIETWSISHSHTKLLLPIDQYEELITLCKSDQEREQFQKLIKNAITKYPDKIHVVITLRLDFEALFQTSVLKDFWNDNIRFVVPPMTQDEFRQAIENPASEKVLYFDPPNLVDELINEVVQMPGALPLLSFTLSELYLKYLGDRTRNNRALTKQDYEELGRVVGSITQRADDEYQKLVKENPAYKNTVQRVMLRMISLQGGELARRQVPKSELVYPEKQESERVNTVIKRFSDARLIVEGSNSQSETYVEPAHDYLVRGWAKIKYWLGEEQDIAEQVDWWNPIKKLLNANFGKVPLPLTSKENSSKRKSDHPEAKKQLKVNLPLQREVNTAANNWWSKKDTDENKKAVGFLWDDDPRLPQLRQIQQSNDNWFNKVEADFVQCSVRKNHQNTIVLWCSVWGFIVVLIGGLFFSLRGQRNALIGQIRASQQASEASWQSGQELDALLHSLRAGKAIKDWPWYLFKQDLKQEIYGIKNQTVIALEQAIYGVKERTRLEEHSSPVTSVSFSPDGQKIASAGWDNKVILWNIHGQKIQTLKGHTDGVLSVSVSSDGKTIASAGWDSTVKLWSLDNGQEITTLINNNTKKNWVYSVSFSPDSQKVAVASEDGTVKLWNINTQETKIIGRHSSTVNSVIFSPDGKMLASSSNDGTVKLWNLDGTSIANLELCSKDNDSVDAICTNTVDDLSFSPDGKMLASASSDKTVKLWNLRLSNIEKQKPKIFTGHTGEVTSVSFSPDGQTIASGSEDTTVKVWNLDGHELTTFKGHSAKITSVRFSPDGQTIASSSEDTTVKIWYLYSQERTTLTQRLSDDGSNEITRISFSPDGQTIAGVNKDKVRLWNLGSQEITTLDIASVASISFSPKEQTIAFGGFDGTVKLWNLGSQKPKTPTGHGHTGTVRSVSYSLDGQTIASASDDKTIKLWSSNGQLLQTLTGHTGGVWSVSFSPDGQTIASGSDGSDTTIKLWKSDGREFREIKTLKGHSDTVNRISFSPDGQTFASASSDNTVKLWSRDGQEIKTLRGHDYQVFDVSFSPDGQMIASADWDGTVKLWSRNGQLLKTFEKRSNKHSWLYSVSFSPDGQTIASASADGILLWNFNLDDLVLRSCDWVRDYLKNNPNVEESDSHLCDGIGGSEPNEPAPVASPISSIPSPALYPNDQTSVPDVSETATTPTLTGSISFRLE
ncbi:hypothetical protein B7486_42840 [cyanobacterium TDX16]|nr:hypothetical protein B7486_42840 [cyanobacterium TDX16]